MMSSSSNSNNPNVELERKMSDTLIIWKSSDEIDKYNNRPPIKGTRSTRNLTPNSDFVKLSKSFTERTAHQHRTHLESIEKFKSIPILPQMLNLSKKSQNSSLKSFPATPTETKLENPSLEEIPLHLHQTDRSTVDELVMPQCFGLIPKESGDGLGNSSTTNTDENSARAQYVDFAKTVQPQSSRVQVFNHKSTEIEERVSYYNISGSDKNLKHNETREIDQNQSKSPQNHVPYPSINFLTSFNQNLAQHSIHGDSQESCEGNHDSKWPQIQQNTKLVYESLISSLKEKIPEEKHFTGNQKRPSSFPHGRQSQRKQNPRYIELSSPNLKERRSSRASNVGKRPLIESIKAKVFGVSDDFYNIEDEPNSWNDEETNPKFPKETKNAMLMMMVTNKMRTTATKHSELELPEEQNAEDGEVTKQVECQTKCAQTSPRPSHARISMNIYKIPCPKNLLCDKGLHRGKCAKFVRQRKMVTCSDDCVCKKERFWCPACQTVWPGSTQRNSHENAEIFPENAFIDMMEPRRAGGWSGTCRKPDVLRNLSEAEMPYEKGSN